MTYASWQGEKQAGRDVGIRVRGKAGRHTGIQWIIKAANVNNQ